MTPPRINNDPWNFHGTPGGSYTGPTCGPRHQHILDDPVIFNYRGPNVTFNIGTANQFSSKGNFWTGLWNGLTGYNNFGQKTGFGIFDLGFAFLAKGLFGGNKGAGLYNTSSFWKTPSLYSGTPGFDTFDKAHTYVQPGTAAYTPAAKKTTTTAEDDPSKKKTTTEAEDPNKKKTTTAAEDPAKKGTTRTTTEAEDPDKKKTTAENTAKQKATAAKTLNDAITGSTPGITHNTRKNTLDVSNTAGTDNVFKGLSTSSAYPKGKNANSKVDGFQEFFYETDSSGNQYAYQFSNYDASTGKVYYKFYESGSHINSSWKRNDKFNAATDLEVLIQDGKIKVINNTTEPIAVPNE